MANEFHIDRQFGVTVFISVKNGIVTNVINEKAKYVNRMKELYKGKSITFLKEDFEKRMAGTYNKVRSTEITNELQYINGFESRIRNIDRQISGLTNSDIDKALGLKLKANRDAFQIELYEAKGKAKHIIKEVEEKHKFKTNYKI